MNETPMVRHHVDVFLLHFVPMTPPDVTCVESDPAMPNVSVVQSICPTRHRHLVHECRVWSIRKASPTLSEDTLSAGIYPQSEVYGYVVSAFPHFNVPIHFRLRDIRNQITESGASRSFARLLRRMRWWLIHNLDGDNLRTMQDAMDRALAVHRG